MSADNIFIKDPDAVVDYVIDWTDWLVTDEITVSSWVLDSGITKDSESNTTQKATVWLSGGTAGVKYKVKNSIETTDGRKNDQTIIILVKEK
jgi:hypothetical protein